MAQSYLPIVRKIRFALFWRERSLIVSNPTEFAAGRGAENTSTSTMLVRGCELASYLVVEQVAFDQNVIRTRSELGE